MSRFKVAIVQASPVYYDLEASFAKAIQWIREAANQGADLVTVGETWLPGYPAWLDSCRDVALWDYQPTKEVFARLHANSITVPGRETDCLIKLAQELSIVLVIGVNEKVMQGRGGGTIYNTLLTIDEDGIRNHHRKLRPTYTERLVWGPGDAAGLKAVDTKVGRVGGLVCWEHWMPLARQGLHNSREDIHVAVWPWVKEMHHIACRHYAFEGRTFVLAAGGTMLAQDLPDEFGVPVGLDPDDFILHGGSAIIAPDGGYIVEPVYDEETIMIAEIDLTEIVKESMTLDVSGHYARDDVFTYEVNRRRYSSANTDK